MIGKNKLKNASTINFGVGLVLGAMLSDRFGENGYLVILGIGTAMIVYGLFKAQNNRKGKIE